MKKQLCKLWKDHKSLLVFLVLMFMFRSSFADWNTVPTGSMKPTILEGDRILVNKMAYDLRIPFTHFSLHEVADPARGDIVVFDSEVSDKRLVKRVVGLPGDLVALADNVLFINGRKLSYRQISVSPNSTDKWENLLGVEHQVRVRHAGSAMDTFDPVRVPEDHYLVMGDNRDNSADSRAIGFIPRAEIVGRTRTVVLSFNYDNFYLPRKDRFMRKL